MANSYKLLIDSPNVAKYGSLEMIEEQVNASEPKKLYLEGVFGCAVPIGEKDYSKFVNQNTRVYLGEEMQPELERYITESVEQGRAYGELSHPSVPVIQEAEISDLTVSIRMESNGDIIGKALVLDTPKGRIERALIEGGGKIGKSSRALGNLQESKLSSGQPINVVNGLRVICFDSVVAPSVAHAVPEAILENKEWIITDDGAYMEKSFDQFSKDLSTLPRHNKQEYIVESFANFLKGIKF